LFLRRPPPNWVAPSTGPTCLQIRPTSGDSAQSRTSDGKQPRPAVCAPEKPTGTTRAHILNHIIVTLRGGNLQVLWRQFAPPPPPEPEQQQAFPSDPPPDGMDPPYYDVAEDPLEATSASMNQVPGSHTESRSKLTGITLILVTPIPHVYIHVTTTIMHFRAFNPETMDNRTGASGRRGYKRVASRDELTRSLVVNDGETDRRRVSIHDL
jgi:hypothetical protein